MSVHTQIKLVERYRSLTGATPSRPAPGGGRAGAPRPNTVERQSFRKPRDEDAYQAELARRRAEARADAKRVERLKAHGGVGAPPVLLVDGYNVCGCDEGARPGMMPELREAFAAGDLETAQTRLVDALDVLAAHVGYRVVCVFDSDRAGARAAAGGIDRATRTRAGTWVVFSVANDADSWIERASLEELAGVSSVAKVAKAARGATPTPRGGVSEAERRDARDAERRAGDAPEPRGGGGGGGGAGEGVEDRGDDDEDARGPGDEKGGARGRGPGGGGPVVYVATSDNALSSVCRGNGAYAVSAGSLVEELARARATEGEILRDVARKARWGGETRGRAMLTKDEETADKLMEMYLAAPNASTTKHLGAAAGFSSKPKKGKKNKKKK
jgi:predicted RNA-binding protein with PIN domain